MKVDWLVDNYLLGVSVPFYNAITLAIFNRVGYSSISNAFLNIVIRLLAKTSGHNKIIFASIPSAPHAFLGFSDFISRRSSAVFIGDRKMFFQLFPIKNAYTGLRCLV